MAASVVAFMLVAGLIGGFGSPVTASIAAVPSASLSAVSCVSVTSCFAVGSGSGKPATLVEHWNGKAWSIVKRPDAGVLNGVSCSTPTSCFAVGDSMLRWDGKTWSIVGRPQHSVVLKSVSCTSATNCFAVGGSLVEHWNGKTWSPAVSPANAGVLESVSCTSLTSCFAVGDAFVAPRYNTVVERWNGKTWSVVPGPTPTTVGTGVLLHAVSCASASSCAAAGENQVGGYDEPITLVERWDGARWRTAKTPSPARAYSWLTGAACTSPTSCVAVGSYDLYGGPPAYNFIASRTLAERWNGKIWSIVVTPNPTNHVRLNAVSCSGAASCVAVGQYAATQQGASKTLVERWDGKSWSIVASPNPAA